MIVCFLSETARSVNLEINVRLLIGRRLEKGGSKLELFFTPGRTLACFQLSENKPESNDKFINLVMTGHKTSRHSMTIFPDFVIKCFTFSSFITLNLSKGVIEEVDDVSVVVCEEGESISSERMHSSVRRNAQSSVRRNVRCHWQVQRDHDDLEMTGLPFA